MKIAVLTFLVCITLNSFSQKNIYKSDHINLTVGKINFGTGDFPGYEVDIEYLKKIKSKGFYLNHFLVGAEVSFEEGKEQPKVINPTFLEFLNQWYYSTTNIILTPKIIYYPFNKTFIKGFNISIGLSIGYTNQNFEQQATYIYDSTSQSSIRRSYLNYINKMIFGYRITTGYEYFITKHFSVGVRLDFDSYTNGDINTLLAGKIGYSF